MACKIFKQQNADLKIEGERLIPNIDWAIPNWFFTIWITCPAFSTWPSWPRSAQSLQPLPNDDVGVKTLSLSDSRCLAFLYFASSWLVFFCLVIAKVVVIRSFASRPPWRRCQRRPLDWWSRTSLRPSHCAAVGSELCGLGRFSERLNDRGQSSSPPASEMAWQSPLLFPLRPTGSRSA